MSPNSARLGTDAAIVTWPPASGCCSNTVTRCPLRRAAIAACRPAGPAPTTITDRGFGGDLRQPDALRLAAGARVLDAAEPAVEAHPADALLVARQAQAGLVGGAGAGLGREVGVGDLSAHHADEIAVAFGERPFGLQRILEATDADTGRSTALRIAEGMNIAYPGGMCIDASIMNRLAVATPIEVLM